MVLHKVVDGDCHIIVMPEEPNDKAMTIIMSNNQLPLNIHAATMYVWLQVLISCMYVLLIVAMYSYLHFL